jgi:hypothetical protein
MSFLGEPFKHDLFVSYSHGAFGGRLDSELKRWSQRFAEDLRKELAGTTEFERISVFLDESERSDETVDRTDLLTGFLRDRVANSALFTLLMTPQYLRSRWCRREFELWWERNHPDPLGVGGRIFVLKILPTDISAWPHELSDIVGYFGYDWEKAPDVARPLGWRGSTRDRDDYIDLIVALSGDMMQRLRAIKSALEERRQREAEAARLGADGGQVIYLHARETDAEVWQRAGHALMDGGFVVVPATPDPIAREPTAIRQIAERRVETLSVCDGLLLLGSRDGRALDADLVVVGRQDRQSARARTERLLPCAVLNTVGPELATPTRMAAARMLGINWIDIGPDVWTREVKTWLAEASAVAERL